MEVNVKLWHIVPSFDLHQIPLTHYESRQGNVGIMIVLFQADATSGRFRVEFEWVLCAILVRFHHYPCIDIDYALRPGHHRVQVNVTRSFSSL